MPNPLYNTARSVFRIVSETDKDHRPGILMAVQKLARSNRPSAQASAALSDTPSGREVAEKLQELGVLKIFGKKKKTYHFEGDAATRNVIAEATIETHGFSNPLVDTPDFS